MRRWLVILALLFAASPASAAPTCQDRNGGTIKCGVQGAMPVGWTPPPERLWDRQLSQPPGPGADTVLTALGILGLIFALIALLPEFDGSHGSDWDVPDKPDAQ